MKLKHLCLGMGCVMGMSLNLGAASSTGAATGETLSVASTRLTPQGEETPNQRRIRLGQPIEASYPAPDYGEKIETPNQARQRLGQIAFSSSGSDAQNMGVAELTPNQIRQNQQ